MRQPYDPTRFERDQRVILTPEEPVCPNCHRDKHHSHVDEDGWFVCRCGCEWAPEYLPAWDRFED